ncbi:MAG: bifunctional N-acetylglucosamine-1-phosphate uridyltransferase/glucosamine-1-phosphate acetyltransferase [Phycisphaerae bacterium]|nr:bifunctional N-acetylglucosamine-1-phosphate uridyltransferase/glucosamine-1-phosphate acetyltransferase [Phycisphaerae bacterium]
MSAAIVLAAGRSTRMNSDLPKVLHEICGRPMLQFVLQACRLAGVERLLVVVGYGRDRVKEQFAEDRDLQWIEQREQHGTGHAVQCCRDALTDHEGQVLVIAGDMPLVRRETLAELRGAQAESGDALVLATAELDDPTGYGRIVRDDSGGFLGIVEDKHCSDELRKIREVNISYYCFDSRRMFAALNNVEPNPDTGEIYLTDTVEVLRKNGEHVLASVRAAGEDAQGINSRLDLARVGRVMQDRIQLSFMRAGVTIVDPDNTWIEVGAEIGRDSVIEPFSLIGAGARVGSNCRIGPYAHVRRGERIETGDVRAAEPMGGARRA